MTTTAPPRPVEARVRRGTISDDLAHLARAAGRVALDTETDGLDWATHELRTVQAHVPGAWTEVVVVDGTEPEALLSLLADPGVAKVFHHAAFDLRFIAHRWPVLATEVRCTKLAAKLLDPQGPHSLKPLLHRRLGVLLDKDQQTSDWSADRLTEQQIVYAAADVEHLSELLDLLTRDLQRAGLDSLYDRCCRHLPTLVDLDVRGYRDVFAY